MAFVVRVGERALAITDFKEIDTGVEKLLPTGKPFQVTAKVQGLIADDSRDSSTCLGMTTSTWSPRDNLARRHCRSYI